MIDTGIDNERIPADVVRLADEGRITIEYTKNIGPHRKLLPLLKRTRDDGKPPLIITADDDVLYPHGWIRAMVECYEETGHAICFRARRIRSKYGRLLKYEEWPIIDPKEEVYGRDILCTGRNGLLVTHSMFDDRIYDDIFIKICPSRSDVWISAALIAGGTDVLKLSLGRLFADMGGLSLADDGDLPSCYLSSKHERTETTDLFLFNELRNDAQISKTFSFFDICF